MSENSTLYRTPYDPNYPVPLGHQRMELALICVFNGLSMIIITARTAYRWYKFRRLKTDDRWMIAAGIFLIFPYWVSQVETNYYGSGLHVQNVPDSALPGHWHWSAGWVGYYIVCSFVKVSVLCCLLEILPYPFLKLRRFVYVLCVIILGLALAESLMWIFQCRPFLSNFLYDVDSDWCLDIDIPRYVWSAVSIPIDFVIVYIPWLILRKTLLQPHEKRVLVLVFAANFLGTLACAAGIYGVWANRDTVIDLYYYEVPFVVTNDIEIFMYTLGASFPVLSRHIIHRAAPTRNQTAASGVPSWRLPGSTFNASATYQSQASSQRAAKWRQNELDSILDSKTWRGYGGSLGNTTTITTEIRDESEHCHSPEPMVHKEIMLDECCRDMDLESQTLSRDSSREMIRR